MCEVFRICILSIFQTLNIKYEHTVSDTSSSSTSSSLFKPGKQCKLSSSKLGKWFSGDSTSDSHTPSQSDNDTFESLTSDGDISGETLCATDTTASGSPVVVVPYDENIDEFVIDDVRVFEDHISTSAVDIVHDQAVSSLSVLSHSRMTCESMLYIDSEESVPQTPIKSTKS